MPLPSVHLRLYFTPMAFAGRIYAFITVKGLLSRNVLEERIRFLLAGRHAQILTAFRAERDEAESPPKTDTAAFQEGGGAVRARVYVQILRPAARILPIRSGEVHMRLRGKR